MVHRWMDGRSLSSLAAVTSPGREQGPGSHTAEAPIPRGFRVGEGVYETLLMAHGRKTPPISWSHHLARFERGASVMGLPWPGDVEVQRQLEVVVSALLRIESPTNSTHTPVQRSASDTPEGPTQASPQEGTRDTGWWRIRLTLAATGPTSLLHPPDRASLWIDVQPATTRVRPPARLQVGPRLRNRADPLSGTKRVTLASDLIVLRRARAAGWDDVVLLDTAGRISEASTSTLLFGLSSGGMATPGPETAPLPGTTLTLMREAGHIVEAVQWLPTDLHRATWAVLLNAVSGARPVQSIGEYVFSPPPAQVVAAVRRLVDGGNA